MKLSTVQRWLSFHLRLQFSSSGASLPVSRSDLAWPLSEHVAICRLGKLLVVDHLIFDADQNLFEGVTTVPVGKHMELVALNDTSGLVDAWQVDLGVEFESGRNIRVVLISDDLKHVNAVVEVRVGWTDNGSVPVNEFFIVT